jgi:Protein of unknown function (DUF4007)
MTFPTHPLRKADLRSLLSQMAHPSTASSLSTTALHRTTQWATAASLIDERGLTPEGRLVATKDPYLETTVTDWLIHFHLSLVERSLWKYFVYEFLPDHVSFTQDEFFSCCADIFITESPDKLKKSLRLILRTYIELEAIAKSKFLMQDKKRYLVGEPDLSNSYTIGYLLARVWERDFKSQAAVLIDEIVNAEMGLSNVLGIDEEHLRQQLDNLAKYEIIEQRSAKPHLTGTKTQTEIDTTSSYQVIRGWETAAELLEKAYENDIATPNRPLIQSLASVLDDDDEIPNLSQLLEWVSELVVLEGGSKIMIKLVS